MIDPKWAWAPYSPSPDSPWDLKKAGHLYRRAAFGATWAELKQAVADGPDKAVDGLLSGSAESPEFAAAATMLNETTPSNICLAPAWWLTRMLEGPYPLREKMTLFWHNHFATSDAKVLNAARM